MLEYTRSFKEDIKSQFREVNLKIGFIKNDQKHWLSSEDVQKHTYRSEIAKSLGGVVRKVINMSLMSTDATVLLQKGDSFNLFYTCNNDGECKVDIFFINAIKTNDRQQIIDIEALDYLSYIKDNPMPFVAMEKNTVLLAYTDRLCITVGLNLVVKEGVVNPVLKLAYPKNYILQDVLDEMGEAMNATLTTKTNGTFGATLPLIVPFSFVDSVISDDVFVEAKPFKASVPVEILDFKNCLIEVSIDDDNSGKYDRVSISLFNPSSSKSNELGKLDRQAPGMTKNVDLGIAEFKDPCLAQVIHFDNEVEIVDFNIGIDRANFKINTKDILNGELSLGFQGLNFNTISNFEESSSKTKIISNLYIQSPNIYDSRIFLGSDISIKYTGNPLLEVGDTIDVVGNTVLITEHELSYTGGLRGTIKGVVIGG